jgi:hypothetical protein
MGRLRILVSLIIEENDYQLEQGRSSQQAGSKLGVAVQASCLSRSKVRCFHWQHESMCRVAHAAVNIGWAVINHEATYLEELRQTSKAPVFGISSDHMETSTGLTAYD